MAVEMPPLARLRPLDLAVVRQDGVDHSLPSSILRIDTDVLAVLARMGLRHAAPAAIQQDEYYERKP